MQLARVTKGTRTEKAGHRYSISLLSWYRRTSTDAKAVYMPQAGSAARQNAQHGEQRRFKWEVLDWH